MSVLSQIPKPVRFAAFGAVGGLLGALLLGELLWRLLEPPPPPMPAPPPPRLALTASPLVSVYQGSRNKFALEFDSDRLAGAAVSVSFAGLPGGLSVAPISGAEKGIREAEVVAGDLPAGEYTLTITAVANLNGSTIQSEAKTSVHVETLPRPMVDIAFALDVSGSMTWAINGVRKGAQRFAGELSRAKVDARFGLVAFRHHLNGSGYLQTLRFKDRNPFTPDPIEFSQEVAPLRASGGGSPGESSLDGVAEAAALPFRIKSTKVILLISDEEPCVPDGKVRSVKEAADLLKSSRIDQLHLVVRSSDLLDFQDLRAGAPGEVFDLERVVDPSGDAFARLLPELSRVIATAAVSAKPPEAQLAVAPPPATLPASEGLQSSRAYDARAQGQLLFAISVWTAAIAAAISLALAAVQYLSLNRRPSAKALLLSLGGGALAGLVGGAVGQGLFMLASGNPLAAALFRVVGWAALGGLAGCGLAFVVPNLQKPHGLVGGLLGGGIGAVGYMLAAYIGLGDFVGRLAGALILGFFIGLMVALVEAVLRRAWLEVRFGGGEVIAVNLGPEPVKVGGDGQQCAVWARGAPPVALRYWLRGPQVFCHDVATGQERAVAGGDYRRAGGVEVTVRTSASGTAQATGTRPTVAVDEEPEVAVRPRPTRPTTQPPPVAPPQMRPAAPAAKSHKCPACGTGVEKPHGICPSCGEMY